MRTLRATRGLAPLVILAIVAAIGGAVVVLKPKVFHGDSQRAAASTEATARVESATTKPAAEAAASIVKIGEANAAAPDSRQRDFIAQEIPVALAKLPAPDPQALLEAEKRRSAVIEGRLEEARGLYSTALQRAVILQRERDAALASRRAVDAELSQVAAERLGAERQRNQFIAVAMLALALFLYVKFTHLAPGALAEAVHDIRENKVDPLHALDAVTSRTQQTIVSWLAHLRKK